MRSNAFGYEMEIGDVGDSVHGFLSHPACLVGSQDADQLNIQRSREATVRPWDDQQSRSTATVTVESPPPPATARTALRRRWIPLVPGSNVKLYRPGIAPAVVWQTPTRRSSSIRTSGARAETRTPGASAQRSTSACCVRSKPCGVKARPLVRLVWASRVDNDTRRRAQIRISPRGLRE